MSKEIIHRHYGVIKNGKMYLNEPKLYKTNLEALEGREFYLTLHEKPDNVSPQFHAYYRGVVIRTAAQSETFGGWTEDEIHTYYASRFLKSVDYRKIKGSHMSLAITNIRSTTALTTKEMIEFVEKVKSDLLIEHGIKIREIENYETS